MCLLPMYLPNEAEPHPTPGLEATETVGFLCLRTSPLSASRVCFNFLAHPKPLACCLTLHLVRIRNRSPMPLCRIGGNPDTERASQESAGGHVPLCPVQRALGFCASCLWLFLLLLSFSHSGFPPCFPFSLFLLPSPPFYFPSSYPLSLSSLLLSSVFLLLTPSRVNWRSL